MSPTSIRLDLHVILIEIIGSYAYVPSYFSIRFPDKTMNDPHLKMISTPLVDDMDTDLKKIYPNIAR